MTTEELEALARRGRYLLMKTVHDSGAGHVGGPLSAMDMLVALYFRVLDIDPQNPRRPDRDRFILSKGHAAAGLYSVMALRGYFPPEELATFDHAESRLQAHPDMTRLPGLDASTGSLGQGLSFGMGIALAARMRRQAFHTFVLMGDGETQEGSVWEAAHSIPRYRLDNITAIIDLNGLQQYGWHGGGKGDRRDPWEGIGVAGAFAELGWKTVEIDGHDFDQIITACAEARAARNGTPTLIAAHTRKGKGLSFTEGKYLWHAKVPDDQELRQAAKELGIAQDEPMIEEVAA